MGLHYRLKSYLTDLKDYIHNKEKHERKENTTDSQPIS